MAWTIRKGSKQSGLVERKTADLIASAAFLIVLLLSLVFLLNTRIASFPTATTTTRTIIQNVEGSNGFSRQRHTTEKTTSEVVPPLWQSLAGSRAAILSFSALSLFAAFLLAAVVQRVLLGQYNFTLGPLTVPGITGEQVRKAADSTLAAVPAEAEITATEPDPIWATVTDPNLALAGWRIDLEKEINRIADEFHAPITNRRGLRGTLLALSQENGPIGRDVVPGLQRLLDLANKGVHGAPVDPSVIEVLRTEGNDILQYLRSIRG